MLGFPSSGPASSQASSHILQCHGPITILASCNCRERGYIAFPHSHLLTVYPRRAIFLEDRGFTWNTRRHPHCQVRFVLTRRFELHLVFFFYHTDLLMTSARSALNAVDHTGCDRGMRRSQDDLIHGAQGTAAEPPSIVLQTQYRFEVTCHLSPSQLMSVICVHIAGCTCLRYVESCGRRTSRPPPHARSFMVIIHRTGALPTGHTWASKGYDVWEWDATLSASYARQGRSGMQSFPPWPRMSIVTIQRRLYSRSCPSPTGVRRSRAFLLRSF